MDTYNYTLKGSENKRKKKIIILTVFVLTAIAMTGIVLRNKAISERLAAEKAAQSVIEAEPEEEMIAPEDIEIVPEKRFVPRNFSMSDLKKRGCVADGLLSDYGGKTKKAVELIDRSECQYLHRALETWLDDPDFERAADIMAGFKRTDLVFGMFIAEAIKTSKEYENPKNGKEVDYSTMCLEGTQGRWGDRTCIPTFNSKKYRDYLKSVTEEAMDIGIQSFMFGQVFLQDENSTETSKLPKVIAEMRKYAKSKNLQIIIGAQTNSITDEKYLRMFDFIEGGVGIDSNGNIEDGPCWSGKQSCWALLWHDQFRKKANTVFLHLDWSGIRGDDMSKFALMTKNKRAETLQKLYTFSVSRNMGFLMPFLAPLYPANNGCHGPTKRFYTPDNRYKCQDEDAINAILKKGL